MFIETLEFTIPVDLCDLFSSLKDGPKANIEFPASVNSYGTTQDASIQVALRSNKLTFVVDGVSSNASMISKSECKTLRLSVFDVDRTLLTQESTTTTTLYSMEPPSPMSIPSKRPREFTPSPAPRAKSSRTSDSSSPTQNNSQSKSYSSNNSQSKSHIDNSVNVKQEPEDPDLIEIEPDPEPDDLVPKKEVPFMQIDYSSDVPHTQTSQERLSFPQRSHSSSFHQNVPHVADYSQPGPSQGDQGADDFLVFQDDNDYGDNDNSADYSNDDGLPDPGKAQTAEKAARVRAVNRTIADHMKTQGATITSRCGIRRKKKNNHYSPEIRAQIGKHALEHGNTSAARHFSKVMNVQLGESAVRSMKKAYVNARNEQGTDDVKELHHLRCGRPLLLGHLDQLVKEHVDAIKEAGGIVNRNIITATARGIVRHEKKTLLTEFGGPVAIDRAWVNSFCFRHNYAKRKATKATRKLPLDFHKKKKEFLTNVKEVVEQQSIPSELVINFDQTDLKIVPVSSQALNVEGAKQIDVVGVDDKREVTMLLGCTLKGDLLPPQLIYQGTTDRCHPSFDFPEDWNVTHSANHSSNGVTMLEYVEKILDPYIKKVKKELHLPVSQKSLVILDMFEAHRCESFLELMKKKDFEVRFVPSSCSEELQPLDLSVNSDLKSIMKGHFTDWYADLVAENIENEQPDKPIDLRISTLKPLHAKWTLSAFNELVEKKDVVKRGWVVAGIMSP